MRKLVLVASVLLLGAAMAQANIMSDSGFDGTLTAVGAGNTLAPSTMSDKWVSAGGSISGGVLNTATSSVNLFQLITDADLAKGTVLTLSVNLKGTWGANITFYLGDRTDLDLSDGSVAATGGAWTVAPNANWALASNTTGGVWQTFTHTWTVPDPLPTAAATAENLMLRVLFAANAGNSLQVDNLTLTPEPTTLSVLGLGALALLRRRR